MRDTPPKHGVAVLGGGPAGLTAALVLARRGVPGCVLEADQQVGGIAKTVERSGFRFDLGGHRFFTKARPRTAPLGADARRRVPRPAAALPDLLSRRVLRVPVAGRGRRAPARPRRDASLRRLVRRGAAPPRRAARHVRGLGHGALRPPPLQRVLPRVHGEGVGHPRQRDPVGVGGAADPQPLLLDRVDVRARAEAEARHEPHRGVPLPAPRPRPDVGGDRGRSRAGGDPGPARDPGDTPPARGRAYRVGGRGRPRRRAGDTGRRGRLEHRALRARPVAGPASRRRRRGRRAAAPLPRSDRGRPRLERPRAVPGQLDLPARPRDACRAGPELRRVERGDDAARVHVPRCRVLLLRRRRALEPAGQRARPAGGARARANRPPRPRPRRRGHRHPCGTRTRCTTPATATPSGA